MPAPLAPAVRRAIQAELALGHGVRAIARRFGCSPTTVVRYRRQVEEAEKTAVEARVGPAARAVAAALENAPSGPL